MLRKLIALVVTLAFLLVGASPAQAVTFGEPDGDAHPYVGTLLFQQGDSIYSCTGTLLSPTIMLTAGHCVEGGGVENSATWVTFDEVPSFAGRNPGEPLADYLNRSEYWITASDVVPHPQYDDYSEFPNTYDVGLVILSEPVALDEYGVLPPLGFLETLKSSNERRFTAVGYGLQGVINPFYSDEYARYRGNTWLIEVKSTRNGDNQSAKFTNNPGGNGGTCFGDSGGPLLHQDSNVIGAVVSFGYTPCIGVDYQFRMDTATAQEFVLPYLQ